MKNTMTQFIKKWFKQAIITSLAILSVMAANAMTADAFTLIEPTVTSKITQNSASPYTVKEGETFMINYCINAPAYITVGIYEPIDANSSKTIDILTNEVLQSGGCYTEFWTSNTAGKYFYSVTMKETGLFSKGNDYRADWIYVEEVTTPVDPVDPTELEIVDVSIDNKTFNPEDDEEASIYFTINKDAYITLEIRDEDDDKVVTLVDDKFYEVGEHRVDWDGDDEDNDVVRDGKYSYELTAKNGSKKDKVSGKLEVRTDDDTDNDTEDPRLKNVFLTKKSFDPGSNEKTYIVFTLTSDADVVVRVDDEKIYDENDLNDGTYVVEWDGDGYEDREGTYTFEISAKNSRGNDSESGEIEVADDSKEDKKPNVYKDSVDRIPYEPKHENIYISFKMDRDAEVTIEIRDGSKVIATLIEEKDLTDGSHKIGWDGKDQYGDYVEDGVYEYKITAANSKGKDVERGYFSVEEVGNAKYNSERCTIFSDVSEDYRYCEAIEWTKDQGIFEGYTDGTFRPNQAINRVEALKVILKTMDVKILDSYGELLGFSDIDRFGWYMPYLRTALSVGIINGYPDGTFRPGQPVNRVEALVMMLNTGKVKHDLIIPNSYYGRPYWDTPNDPATKWYISYAWFAQEHDLTGNEYYLYPGANMSRGELADMLYRYHQAGLDD